MKISCTQEMSSPESLAIVGNASIVGLNFTMFVEVSCACTTSCIRRLSSWKNELSLKTASAQPEQFIMQYYVACEKINNRNLA